MQRTFEIEELLSESGWLRMLAASLVADPAQADDLVQDTWLAALRHPPRTDSAPRPWLARVAHNLARNSRRGSARREARETFAAEERAEPGPEVLAHAAEAQRLLAEAVTRLSAPLRDAIVLRYFQGLDSRICAERLGIPASTVRTRLQSALAELRADLDRRAPGGRAAWAGLLTTLARTNGGTKAGVAGGAASATLLGSWSVVVVAGASALGVAVIVATRPGRSTEESVALGQTLAASLAVAESPVKEEEDAPASELVARPAERAALAQDPQEPIPAPPAAGATKVSISGTIRVDGRVPEWPLELTLEPTLPPEPSRKDGTSKLARVPAPRIYLEPEQRGVFAFEPLPPTWSGRLRVDDHTFADGSPTLALPEPRGGLTLELRSGPALTGRLLLADGTPGGGLEGRLKSEVVRAEADEYAIKDGGYMSLTCREDGCFRIPLVPLEGSHVFTLRVEAAGRGFLQHESAPFLLADGYDFGDLQLEPVRTLAFHVRDSRGPPIADATARVGGLVWSSTSEPTDAEGSGSLAFVPERRVAVTFRADRFVAREVTVDGEQDIEVELEPLATLQVRFNGAGFERAKTLVIVSESPAFLPPEQGGQILDAPGKRPLNQRVEDSMFLSSSSTVDPGVPGGRLYQSELSILRQRTISLAGLVPGVPLTLEVRDSEWRLLTVSTITVGPQEAAEIEITVP